MQIDTYDQDAEEYPSNEVYIVGIAQRSPAFSATELAYGIHHSFFGALHMYSL